MPAEKQGKRRIRGGRKRFGRGDRASLWILSAAAVAMLGACADPFEVDDIDNEFEEAGPLGLLTIEVATTGPAQDADGYLMRWNRAVVQQISPNGRIFLTAIVSGNPVALELDGVADNCLVIGGPIREVTLSSESESSARFDVECSVPTELADARIVLSRDGDLYSERLDGSDRIRLTTTGAAAGPSVSRDGSRIAYVAGFPTTWNGDIHIMNVDGTNDRALTTSAEAFDPSFSPDGGSVAFVEGSIWSGALRIRSLGTGEVTELLASGNNSQVAWSPDGRRLAFRRYSLDDAPGIYILDVDGRHPALFAPQSDSPVWSPDSGTLAYSADGVVHLRALDGNTARPIVPANLFFWLCGCRLQPSDWWSGGEWLAVTAEGAGFSDIYLLNVETSEILRITRDGRSRGAAFIPPQSGAASAKPAGEEGP